MPPYLPPESIEQQAGEQGGRQRVNIYQSASLFYCAGGFQGCGEITPPCPSCERELPAATH